MNVVAPSPRPGEPVLGGIDNMNGVYRQGPLVISDPWLSIGGFAFRPSALDMRGSTILVNRYFIGDGDDQYMGPIKDSWVIAFYDEREAQQAFARILGNGYNT